MLNSILPYSINVFFAMRFIITMIASYLTDSMLYNIFEILQNYYFPAGKKFLLPIIN